ncbi:MAG: hypothetical protein LJE67_03375 [Salaquimonas sp.]|nr:hypothetical protein [Salaquimonas sp.]
MKLFYGIKAPWQKARPARRQVQNPGDFANDPLSHPVIARMSPTELADLPFNRRATRSKC